MIPGRRARALLGLVAFLLGSAFPAAATEVPSPASVLGFEPGTERRLADWMQITEYFHRLDAASDRVRVSEVGKTTDGLPFLVVTITSAANMARLEELRALNLRLADPRGLSRADADQLVGEGKAIVALQHGIHSTEVGPPQASMLTAHWLASSDTPEVLEILDRCVVLLLPSHNPDGTQRVVEWYRKSLGTPHEGGEVPFLYHRYAGHDNNRDWYAFNLVESRLTVTHVYDRWRPQIVHDLHQMGTKGPRIFVPPYTDPYEPNVDPALVAAINALGTHVAARLVSEGKTGVAVHALFDGYSPTRAYPHTHGGVRFLSEVASARMASPLEVPFADLQPSGAFDPKQAAWNFPAPWPGGPWTLRDIVDYELSATRALLEHAARNREFWLRNFTDVLRRASTRTDLFAFVLPRTAKDPYALGKLVEILRTGGVEVHRARTPFRAQVADRPVDYPAGSYVVRMQQPFSAFAKQVLEPQVYPDLRQYPGGPPLRPYDVTAHTLPLLMGVAAVAVAAPFESDLEPVGEGRPAVQRVPAGPDRSPRRTRFLALGHKTGDLIALGRLLRQGIRVRWATEAFTDRERTYAAGTLLVPASARGMLAPVMDELGLRAEAIRGAPKALTLRAPRVGLYQSWVPNMDEGWTRFVFEQQMGVAYETLHDGDVNRGSLRARFDAIVLPDQAAAQILGGHASGVLPDEFTGGLQKAGAARLLEFVAEGGTLVALDTASLFATAELGLPLKAVATPDLYCPGALVRARVQGEGPLVHGLDPEVPVWFESGPVLEADATHPKAAGITQPNTKEAVSVAMRYAPSNLLASGYLLGEAQLAGQPALLEVRVGKGRVILFGFRPQYRAQSWGTYVPFLNALYLSAAEPGR